MSSLDQFAPGAEIALSDFRSEGTVVSRLETFHRLRVRRRSDVVGVFLDVAEWQSLVKYVARLENELERHDSEAVRTIVSERALGAAFEPGSHERMADIDREYERLVAERPSSGPRP